MKNTFLVFIAVFISLVVVTPVLATNITIYDQNGYKGAGQGYEDGETEPGMVNAQKWDLEGFFFENNELSMVGGFNFKDGVAGYERYSSGDIFISTTGKPEFGDIHGTQGFNVVDNTYGFDYVIDLDIKNGSYVVFNIGTKTKLETAYYGVNQGSSPWRYVSGGEAVEKGGLTFTDISGQSSEFYGNSRYSLTGFDLSFLGEGVEFYSHFTMGCGNDNLMGHGNPAPVPEPATMVLLGSGLVGLALYRRKMKK